VGHSFFLTNLWKAQKSCTKCDKTLSKISNSKFIFVNGTPKPQKLLEDHFTAKTYLNSVSVKCQSHGATCLVKSNFSYLLLVTGFSLPVTRGQHSYSHHCTSPMHSQATLLRPKGENFTSKSAVFF